MARRATTTGQYLTLTSGLSAGDRQTFTAMAWIYTVSCPTLAGSVYYGTQIELGSSAGACAQLYTAAGTPTGNYKFSLYDGTNFNETTDADRTVNTWYHVALVRSANVLTLYVNGVSSFSLPSNAITPGTAWRFLTDASNTYYHNGRMAAVKYFAGVALTTSQIAAEMRQYLPKNSSSAGSCHAYYPLLSGVENYAAGAAGTLTVTGTVATEEGPPIVWNSSRPRWTPYVVAFGGNQTATPGVATVTLTGASPTASGSGTGTATAGTATATITGVSPSATATGSVTSTPGTASVTLTGVSPTVSATGASTATAGVGTVTLTGASPTATGSGTGTVIPGAASVTLTGTSPAAAGSGTGTATAGTGTVTLSGVSPTVAASGSVTATPGIGTVTLTGENVAASGGGIQSATAGVATVSLSGVSPTIAASGSVTATAGVATITLSGIDAAITATGTATVSPGFGLVTLTGANVSASTPTDGSAWNYYAQMAG